jgi:hypothetical protein
MPSADREVVDPEDPYHRQRPVRQPADQPQHRVPADRHSEPGRQPRPGATGQGQPNLFQHVTQATAATGVRHGQALDLLGEPPHRTAPVLADEHPNPQHERNLPAAHREIGQTALVTAVHPPTATTASRTRRPVGLRTSPDPQLNCTALDALDRHIGQPRQQHLKTMIIAPTAQYTVDNRPP